MTNKQTDLENRYLGRQCFKTVGSNAIYTGQIKEVRYRDTWAEGRVFWLTKNGVSVKDREQTVWEKIPNLGFHDLPFPDKAEQSVSEPSTDPSPFSAWHADTDCQGLPEEEATTQLTLEFTDQDQPPSPKNKGKQTTETHPHVRAPKRDAQSEEANRQVNYRALLALLDGKKRNGWHVLQLNEDLKREGCNTITIKAFDMRVNAFEKSYKRSLMSGSTYRIEAFLTEAFDGKWHGQIGKESIWSRF